MGGGEDALRVIADLQIHSRFSAATSTRMNLREITVFARMKGLNVVGTGDALHPRWLEELRAGLLEDGGSGLYLPKHDPHSGVHFLAQTEVATVHSYGGKARRIHHVILMHDLEMAESVRDVLRGYGNLEADGRPVLNMTPAHLVESVMELSPDNFIFPAHAWTPWWSIFGAFGGVDSVDECYEDMTKHIHAIETGLSSDPPMNWRVSWLDNYMLLSSSDAHSPYPYRIGREAVVFEVSKLAYDELVDAVRGRDRSRVVMTLEVPPAYGKYHWSGHRDCGVGPLSPSESRRLGYRCPVCGRKLTKGVEDRVEELADREPGYRPERAVDFRTVIPLQELIAISAGLDTVVEGKLMSRRVWTLYERLTGRLGNEFTILLDTPIETIGMEAGPELAHLIRLMREGKLEITPGYDGVYGRLRRLGR
ncbi:MAG: endonuclease Q family protein [Nitrososphaerota archaeon]